MKRLTAEGHFEEAEACLYAATREADPQRKIVWYANATAHAAMSTALMTRLAHELPWKNRS